MGALAHERRCLGLSFYSRAPRKAVIMYKLTYKQREDGEKQTRFYLLDDAVRAFSEERDNGSPRIILYGSDGQVIITNREPGYEEGEGL